MKKYILPILILSFVLTSSFALAQNNTYYPAPSGTNCVNLTYNLHYGSRDFFTNGEVTELQNFLVTSGYGSFTSSGYFGSLTFRAVQQFQNNNGIISTGYVGPLTRAKIQSISCGGISNNLSISYLSPSSGPIGTSVTVYGSGFNSTANSINFDGEIIPNLSSSNGTSLSFTVPAAINPPCYYSVPRCLLPMIASRLLPPGPYTVSVTNSNGTSNSVTFVVTSSVSNNIPVINGISTPTNLNTNQTGTWTVSASDPQNEQLSYSVNWGDNVGIYNTATPAYNNSFQQTATFTHSYSQPGTYTQTFTVKNTDGAQAQTSTTVQVGNVSNNVPYLSYLSPTSGPIGSTVTIYGSGFLNTNTVLFDGGPINNVSSNNGNVLSFTVPNAVGADCQQGMACPQYARLITPGLYNISVRNNNGTSNFLSFTVTGSY